jgi:hypothetical protein
LVNLRIVSNTLGTATLSGNTLTVQGFTLQPGQRATVVIQATIARRATPGLLINIATLESPDASIHVSNEVQITILPETLPATGQSPWAVWRWVFLLVVLGGLSLGTAYLLRRRRLLQW